jgi:hypothetical protein
VGGGKGPRAGGVPALRSGRQSCACGGRVSSRVETRGESQANATQREAGRRACAPPSPAPPASPSHRMQDTLSDGCEG